MVKGVVVGGKVRVLSVHFLQGMRSISSPFFSVRTWIMNHNETPLNLCILYFRAVLSTIMLVSLSCLMLAYVIVTLMISGKQ